MSTILSRFQYIEDGQTLDYIDGLTTHWYAATTSPTVAEFAKNKRKQLFLLAADASKLQLFSDFFNAWVKYLCFCAMANSESDTILTRIIPPHFQHNFCFYLFSR